MAAGAGGDEDGTVREETLWPMWAGGYRTKCATFFSL